MELYLTFLSTCFQEQRREMEGGAKKVTMLVVDKDTQKAQLGLGI